MLTHGLLSKPSLRPEQRPYQHSCFVQHPGSNFVWDQAGVYMLP